VLVNFPITNTRLLLSGDTPPSCAPRFLRQFERDLSVKKFIVCLSFLSATVCANPAAMDVFRMELTGCYGTCPRFDVQVFADGLVVFNGQQYTEYVGIYRLPTNPELFQEILRLLDESNFQQFPSRVAASRSGEPSPCRESWTDDATTLLTMQTADQQKTIAHYHGCKGFPREAELVALEKQLIERTGIAKLIAK